MRKICKGRALYTEIDKIWIAQGMCFYAIDYSGHRITEKCYVGTPIKRLVASNRISRQLLREGIHHLIPLPDGNKFITTKKKSYIIGQNGSVVSTFTGYRGNKPAHQGVCITPNGYIFFGEYTLNTQREHDTHLYRSTDGGLTFHIVLTLNKNEVRHIHFVKWDPYEKCIWLGTGDKDYENILMRSNDYGNTWERIGGGSQDWRAIGICFSQKYILWGTDAGSVPDTNHIIRMSRTTNNYEIIDDAEGPCHGCASFKDGRVFISTGVEGGINENDCYARIKELKNGKVIELLKIEKDWLPLIIQYGVIRFPLGSELSEKLVFTTLGLKRNGEYIYVE